MGAVVALVVTVERVADVVEWCSVGGSAVARGSSSSSVPMRLPRPSNSVSGTLSVGGLGVAVPARTSSAQGIGTSETAAPGASASAALGPGEAAALGASDSAPPGASAYALAGTASTEALHTFTLDSGASRYFFRDRTTLEQLARPVAVSLADPSGGPVLATSSIVLPCPAVPSGTLSGLYLPSFSTTLVAGFALQDGGVHQFTPAYERVTHCTCARTGRHLATFTRQPGSDLYTLTTESPQVAASASALGQLSPPCSCRSLSHQTVLWHHRLGHPLVQRLRGMHSRYLVSGLPRVLPPLPPSPAPPCLPCVEGRQCVAPHSSSFPPTEAPLQTLHLDLCVSTPETSRTLLWTGQVGDALRFRVWGARAFVRDTTADKLSARAVPCVFLGFVPDVPGWQFCHPTSRRVFPSQDVTFDESVPFYRLFPYRTAPLPPPPLFLTPGAPSIDPLPPQGPAPSGVSQVDAVEPVEVALDSGPERGTEPVGTETGSAKTEGAEPGGAATGGAEPLSAKTEGAETGGAEAGGAEPGSAEPGGTEPGGVDPGGAPSSQQLCEWYSQRCGLQHGAAGATSTVLRPEPPSPQRLREWYARRCSLRSGASSFELPPAGGPAAPGGAAGATGGIGAARGAASIGPAGGTAGAAGGPGVAGGAAGAAGGTGAAGGAASTGPAGGAAGATGGPGVADGAAGGTGAAGAPSGAPGSRSGGAAGVGATRGTGVDTPGGATGAVGVGAAARGSGALLAGSGGTSRPRPYFVPLLQQVLGQPPPPCPAPSFECLSPVQLQSQFQPTSPLPSPSPYTGPTRGLTERREPKSRPMSPESRSASPVRAARPGCRVSRQRPRAVPGTHQMLLRLSTAPQRVPLSSPPTSSLPALADPESESLCAANPTVTRLLATVVTDPSFQSAAASALVTELLDFVAHCRLDYAASLVAESESVCPPSVGGECSLGTDVLEDRQEEFECFPATVPHLVSMLIAPEGDPDAPDIPTPCSYAEAIASEYSSQWQTAMDAEMASWKSTGTYVDEVPPPGANIVSGMWIFKVKWPPGSSRVFKARYVARGFSQREGVDFFHTFSPTPKMTTLRGNLHKEIWLRPPPGFTGSFPPGTQWSLRRPVYDLRQAPREWHDTLRTTLAALGFSSSTADPSLFLCTDTSMPPFYILVYVDDLVFATADTEALTHVKSELQKRHTCTYLGELTSYLGLRITRDRARRTITLTQSHMVQQVLQRIGFTWSSAQTTPLATVGCLMYLMTCTRPDLAYPLGLLARYVAPGWHRKVHMDAARRVLRYLCSTCEAEIYAIAMAAQELRWLTYLLTDLGERPSSPPVLYVDNKAAIALCEEHRLEHRTKHIALRYFLARELQQRG
ncbi:unnamed protein product [Closterium sp. NIES-54]